MRRYIYVGTNQIAESCKGLPAGRAIESRAGLKVWLESQSDFKERDGLIWATFTVKTDEILYLAPRRSEHFACAGGQAVLAAGEMAFDSGTMELVVVTNQSLGYCPDVSCWPAVAQVLERTGVEHGGSFTDEYIIRRCPNCQQRNIVKDGHYICQVCGADLPEEWNF